jgi:hypothetical protein
MIATRQRVYRVLRAPHRDSWLDEPIVRFADAIARVGEPTFRLDDRARVRDEVHLRNERAATTHRASSHVIRRRVALMRLSLRTRGARDCMNGRSYTMPRRSSLTMRRSGRPAYRMRPRGALIRRGVETIVPSRERNSTNAGCESTPRRSERNPHAVYHHPAVDCPHPRAASRHVVVEHSAP